MSNYIKLFILALLVIVLLLAMLYSLQCIGIIFGLNGDTGAISDSIGGVFSPIIALFSCVLMYLAFNEQRKANEITRKQFGDERSKNDVDRLYDFIVTGIKNFKYQKKLGIEVVEDVFLGELGIEKFVHDLRCRSHDGNFKKENDVYVRQSTRQLEGILTISNALLDKLNQNFEIEYFCSLKLILTHLLNMSIFEGIKLVFNNNETRDQDLKKTYCTGCECDHGFSKEQISLLCEVYGKLYKDSELSH